MQVLACGLHVMPQMIILTKLLYISSQSSYLKAPPSSIKIVRLVIKRNKTNWRLGNMVTFAYDMPEKWGEWMQSINLSSHSSRCWRLCRNKHADRLVGFLEGELLRLLWNEDIKHVRNEMWWGIYRHNIAGELFYKASHHDPCNDDGTGDVIIHIIALWHM